MFKKKKKEKKKFKKKKGKIATHTHDNRAHTRTTKLSIDHLENKTTFFFDARAASFVRVLLFASREFVHFSKEEEEKKKTLDFGSLDERGIFKNPDDR